MKKYFDKAIRKFKKEIYYPYHYQMMLVNNYFKGFFQKETDSTYLFILSPPYCGSTLMNEFIATSRNVSANNNKYTREGQRLPSVEKIMYRADRWEESTIYD